MPGGNRSACLNDAFKNLTDEIDLAQLLMTDARKRRMAGSVQQVHWPYRPRGRRPMAALRHYWLPRDLRLALC
jgi:hypothetical protein